MNVHTLPERLTCARAIPPSRDLLSVREIVILADIPEKRVRKDIETGVLESPGVWRLNDARLCFPWFSVFPLAAVYSNKFLTGKLRRIALTRLYFSDWESPCIDFDTWAFSGCYQNKHLVHIDEYVKIDLFAACERLFPKVTLYMRGLRRVEEKPDILGGEAVFKDTRLSVLHVGKMVENGESVANILEDYPYLSKDDVEFAHIYYLAHPLVGRPRVNEGSEGNAKACLG